MAYLILGLLAAIRVLIAFFNIALNRDSQGEGILIFLHGVVFSVFTVVFWPFFLSSLLDKNFGEG